MTPLEPVINFYGTNEYTVRQDVRVSLAQRVEEELARKGGIKDPQFEKAHPRGKGGKFAKKVAGKSFPKTGPNRKLKLGGLFPQFERGERHIKVKGILRNGKGLTTYEMTLTNGQKIELVDETGKAGPFAREWLEGLANMQELYGYKPPRKIIVHENPPKGQKEAFAWVLPESKGLKRPLANVLDTQGDNGIIHLNFAQAGRKEAAQSVKNMGKRGWAMDAAQSGNGFEYIIAHEFGHTYQLTNHRAPTASMLFKDSKVQSHMSKYGASAHEAYAEAFAEWHVSRGKTSNLAAQVYAKTENWVGYKDLQASGAVGLAAEDSSRKSSKAPAGKEKDQSLIIDFFDGKTPAIFIEGVGTESLVGEEPTEVEITSVKKIIEEFFPKEEEGGG